MNDSDNAKRPLADTAQTQESLPGVPTPTVSAAPPADPQTVPPAPEDDGSAPFVPGQLPLPLEREINASECLRPESSLAEGSEAAPTDACTDGSTPLPHADEKSAAAHSPTNISAKAPGKTTPEIQAASTQETESEAASAPQNAPTPEVAPLSAASSSSISFSPTEAATPTAPTASPTPERGFFPLHPIVPTPSGMDPSLGSRIFDLIARAPWLVLILMLAAQTIFSLDARALWFSDEVRHADAFRNLLEHGRGVVLQLNGEDYWDKPPLYFWFLRGIYEVIRVEGPVLYFTGAAVSALLYLLSFLLLGRFVERADGRTLLASGIILFCGGFVYGLLHYARMDFLFSACIICAYAALYHALIRPRSFLFSLLAFALAGVACLIKGPLGLALPLAAGIFFVFWRGKPHRLLRLDMALGLLTACAVVAVWVVLVHLEQGSLDDLIREVWHKQILARAGHSFAHKEPFWYYVRLPLLLMPFSLVLFCLPWHRLFSSGVRERFRFLRRPEGEGRAFLWCIALSALVLLSCLSGKILIYYLPALPAVALLASRAILELSGFRAALFRRLIALVLVLAGLGLFGATLVFFGALPAPAGLGLPAWRITGSSAFYLAAFGLIAAGLFLFMVLKSSRPEGVLLSCALAFTLLSYPLARDVAPAFDAVLSPKGQSLVMKSWMEKGYLPFSYKNYPGIYAYYAGSPVKDIESLAELPPMPGEHGVVLAIRRKDLKEWSGRPACFKEVDARYIEHPERVLLVCPPKEAVPVPGPETPVDSSASSDSAPAPEQGADPDHAVPANSPPTTDTTGTPDAATAVPAKNGTFIPWKGCRLPLYKADEAPSPASLP